MEQIQQYIKIKLLALMVWLPLHCQTIINQFCLIIPVWNTLNLKHSI